MGPYVWCVIGAIVGALAIMLGGETDFVRRVESVGVGVFGAFIGGQFLPTMFLPAAPQGAGLGMPAVALAIGCAIFAVFLLRVMRKAVGPMKTGKKRNRNA
ncbi:MAG TPA: hypothetical protein VIE63_15215 [Ramlibacter sp.]|jgi:uncharacterized membrane protein YeaQ/YmgE (transglycosylase-associated protein family)